MNLEITMIKMIKYFYRLFLASFLFSSIAAAQGTSPITDTTKRADTTKKHVLTGRMLGMSPIYDFSTHDNAAIDMAKQFPGARPLPDSCYYAGEKHLKNVKQLSFEGENAEAYLSPDDKFITFQAHGKKSGTCDQIYMMPIDGSRVKRISTGAGRTTCSYFLPGGDKILYSSTRSNMGRNTVK